MPRQHIGKYRGIYGYRLPRLRLIVSKISPNEGGQMVKLGLYGFGAFNGGYFLADRSSNKSTMCLPGSKTGEDW